MWFARTHFWIDGDVFKIGKNVFYDVLIFNKSKCFFEKLKKI
jgi:hypothetical protein